MTLSCKEPIGNQESVQLKGLYLQDRIYLFTACKYIYLLPGLSSSFCMTESGHNGHNMMIRLLSSLLVSQSQLGSFLFQN